MLLPCTLFLIGLLSQPACLLYTRCVMGAAASETLRAVTTARGDSDLKECEAFARRRLAAVPEVPVFHVGGRDDWKIKVEAVHDGKATVSIEGHARPLPLFSALSAAFTERDGKGIVLRCKVSEKVRPGWLGGGYGDWVSMWGK